MIKKFNKFISENTSYKIAFDDDIKNELKKLFAGSVYDDTNSIDYRIDHLLKIHNTWLEKYAKKLYSAEEIAKKLIKYEKDIDYMNLRKIKENKNVDLNHGEIIHMINNDIKHIYLSDEKVIKMTKDILEKIFNENQEKYYDIIDIIKLQNEIDNADGKKQRSKYTNLVYLKNKEPHEIKTIKNKWLEMKKQL
jgi:hypothetical protein